MNLEDIKIKPETVTLTFDNYKKLLDGKPQFDNKKTENIVSSVIALSQTVFNMQKLSDVFIKCQIVNNNKVEFIINNANDKNIIRFEL
jgi:hypothetical protein